MTAVQWLIDELTRLGHNFKLYQKEIEQAKQMEKEQIIDSYKFGYLESEISMSEDPEKYYNETYKK